MKRNKSDRTADCFADVPRCFLCGGEGEVFFETPFRSPVLQDFVHHYYGGRIDEIDLSRQTFRIKHCAGCDLYWQDAVLKPKYLDRLYGEWIDPEESRNKQIRMSLDDRMANCHLVARLLKALPNRRTPTRVLDFGGGWSTLGLCAKALGCETYLIETSPERVKQARAQGIGVFDSLDEVADEFFDLVILNQVLEHIPHPTTVLKTIATKLRRGGGCYAAVPHAHARSKVVSKGPFQPLEHVNGFTPKSLRTLLTVSGLTPAKDYAAFAPLQPKKLVRVLGYNALLKALPQVLLPRTTRLFALRNV